MELAIPIVHPTSPHEGMHAKEDQPAPTLASGERRTLERLAAVPQPGSCPAQAKGEWAGKLWVKRELHRFWAVRIIVASTASLPYAI